jgi:purine-cytosine permease-like protein
MNFVSVSTPELVLLVIAVAGVVSALWGRAARLLSGTEGLVSLFGSLLVPVAGLVVVVLVMVRGRRERGRRATIRKGESVSDRV